MRIAVRALLAVSLLAGFYLLVFTAVALDVIAMVIMVTSPPSPGETGILGLPSYSLYLVAASVPLLIAVCRGVFAASGFDAQLPGAVLIGPSQAAELCDLVDELAAQLGTRAPTQILLTSEANAMVSEESIFLGLIAGNNRRLYIGAPLLAALSVDELRAVLCHELGHYARKHTRLSAVVYRGAVALNSTLGRLREGGAGDGIRAFGYAPLLYLCLSWYAKLYRRLSSSVNRRQELEADDAAASISSPQVTAEALCAVNAVTLSWSAFTTEVIAPMRNTGRLPDDPFSAYRAMVTDLCFLDQFAHLKAFPPALPTRAFDTHPSLADRLRRLDSHQPADGRRDPRSALDLFTDYHRAFERTGSKLFPYTARPRPWKQWLDLAAETRAAGPQRSLQRVVDRLAGADAGASASASADANTAVRSPLAWLLDFLEREGGAKLAAALDGPHDVPGNVDPSTRLIAALLSLVGQALVTTGAATWHLNWTGAAVLVPREVTSEELADLVAAAVRNRLEVPRLRLHLASLGLDPDAPIATGDPEQPSRPPAHVLPASPADEARRRKRLAYQTVIATICVILLLGLASRLMAPSSSFPTALPGQQWQTPYSLPTDDFQYPYPLPNTPIALTLPSLGPLPSFAAPLTTTIVVRPGDSLSAIAQRCASTVAELQELNGLGSSTMIHTGQTLLIPGILLPRSCD